MAPLQVYDIYVVSYNQTPNIGIHSQFLGCIAKSTTIVLDNHGPNRLIRC